MTHHTKPTLVIGGTGKTGRRVAERLEGRGIPTRIGSRSADRPLDWEDPGTWPGALKGAGAAYISYYPDVAQGVPSEFVEFLTYLFGEVLDGRNASLTDGVQRALGREPRDFSEFTRETAASGVWNAPAKTA